MAQVPTGGNYVVDNSTGANVRADINEIFDAILTVNSGSTSPSYAKAYTLWADTNAGTMKIRNGANNAWIELFQLDGTLTLEDGSASTPALAFRDDLNTGIFSSAADTFNVATGGVERMELGATTVFNEDGADVDFRVEGDTETNLLFADASTNRIGIGTSSPSGLLHISGDTCQMHFTDEDDSSSSRIYMSGSTFAIDADHGNSKSNTVLALRVDNSERMRIDSSGNVGIGTTNPVRHMHLNGSDSDTVQLHITNITTGTTGSDGISFALGSDESLIINQRESNHIALKTADTERMRIDSNGKLMVGGTTADAKFAVIDSANPDIAMRYNGTSANHKTRLMFMDKRGVINAQVANVLISDGVGDATANMEFATAKDGTLTARMILDNDGRMLLGTTSAISAGFANINYDRSLFHGLNFKKTSGSGINIGFLDHNSNFIGSIQSTDSATSYNTSSDYRLKENAVAISDGITRLKTLKPYKFNWIVDETNTLVDGFFAHEVSDAVPEAVTGTKDQVATDSDIGHTKGDPIYQQIDQSKLVPLLVAAVQELITKVETLEAA